MTCAPNFNTKPIVVDSDDDMQSIHESHDDAQSIASEDFMTQ